MKKQNNKVKKVKVKAYAVIWYSKEVRRAYGVPAKETILSMDTAGDDVEIEKDLRGYLPILDKEMGDSIANYLIFCTRRQAEVYRDKNNDWKVIPVEISYTIPIISKRR